MSPEIIRTALIPWWVKPILLFKKRVVYKDEEYPYVIELHAKRFRGTVYILDIKRYIPPPEHFNCRCATARVDR